MGIAAFIDRFLAGFKPTINRDPEEPDAIKSAKELAKEIIREFEGLRLKSYTCPAGKLTIGYGHVIKPDDLIEGRKILREGERITRETAEELLELDVISAGISLRTHCLMPLTPEQEAALLSFIFNVGEKAFADSTLKKHLCFGRYEEAAAEFPRWVHANGRKLQGLVRRRKAEQRMFLNG